MRLQNFFTNIVSFSAIVTIAAFVAMITTAQADSKKGDGIFGKPVDHDWEPSGGDPAKGPGMLDHATIRVGNTIIRTGDAAKNAPASSEISKAERARKARQMQNRSIDSTTPR